MKTFRKAVVEISLAFLIAGCIFFFPDKSTSGTQVQSASFNILTAADKSHYARHKSAPTIMKPLQNCTTGNTTILVAAYNRTTNITTYINFTNYGACLSLPGSSGISGVQTIVYPYLSLYYQMILNLDCLYGASYIVQTVASILGVDQGQIQIISISCGSLTVQFLCASTTSVQDATNICDAVVAGACSQSNQLYQKLQGQNCGRYTPPRSGSSTSLYALFALVALPVLILGCLILWYRTRQREADNQYMQDTATFSNVASSPQPLGAQQYYPPASTFTGAGPYPVVGDPYLKPY
jgi:hypothetical protein